MAERFALGYWQSALIFGALIGIVASLHFRFGLNADPGLLDRLHPDPPARRVDRRLPVPAAADGGLGLGTTVTSVLFLRRSSPWSST